MLVVIEGISWNRCLIGAGSSFFCV